MAPKRLAVLVVRRDQIAQTFSAAVTYGAQAVKNPEVTKPFKYWADKKLNLRKKLTARRASWNKMGGGPGVHIHISDTDQQIIDLVGDDCGVGLPGVAVPLHSKIQDLVSISQNDCLLLPLEHSDTVTVEEILEVDTENYQETEPCMEECLQMDPDEFNMQTPKSHQCEALLETPLGRLPLERELTPTNYLEASQKGKGKGKGKGKTQEFRSSLADAQRKMAALEERRISSDECVAKSLSDIAAAMKASREDTAKLVDAQIDALKAMTHVCENIAKYLQNKLG